MLRAEMILNEMNVQLVSGGASCSALGYNVSNWCVWRKNSKAHNAQRWDGMNEKKGGEFELKEQQQKKRKKI